MEHPQARSDSDPPFHFGVLGPLTARQADGRAVELSSSKVRALLAVLLLEDGRPVSRDRLIAALWGESPPATAPAALNNAVLRLRRALGPAGAGRLRTEPPGYLLALEPGELDTDRFGRRLRAAASARADGHWTAVERECAQALELWRGAPLGDLPELAEQEAPRLQRLQEGRLQLLEWHAEARLRLGQERDAIGELTHAAAEHPLHEIFHEQLMLALHRLGRQADAIAAYHRVRGSLAEELGIDPGPRLLALYQRILLAPEDAPAPAPASATAAEPAPVEPPALPVPSQLPGAPADFTGRAAEAALLLARLGGAGPASTASPSAAAAAVCTVAGTGGLGKTSLALHVAHRLAERYPDGRLYVDLRGAGPDPVEPADVLADFLRDFGVPDEAIPVGEAARAARFRSLLDGRRVLLVLDNARDSAQVRPLLPGAAGCATVVTGRRRMPGLAGATLVDLERLDGPASRELFTAVVGAERADAEPEATEQVLAHCAGLPLALRIAAARLSHRRGWSIASMAARLADHSRRLDELRADDLAVRASFRMSYEQLTEVEKNLADGPSGACPQRLFRLLGLAPGPDVGVLAAAALIDRPAEDVEEVLEQLVDACLLESPAPGRYRMHDLLRVFAAERAAYEESEAERNAARARVVRWYLLGMTEADLVLFPGEIRPEPLDHAAEPLPPHRPLGFADRAAALEWCAAERINVIQAAQLAAQLGSVTPGLDEYGWRFCSVAWAYFNRTAHLEDWLAVADAGLVSGRRLDRPYVQGTVLTSRGAALMRQGELCRARESFLEALEIRRVIGDRSGQVALLNNLGLLAQRAQDHDEARAFFRQALALLAPGPDGRATGFAASSLHGNLGQSELAVGDYPAARESLERSLALAQELGNRSTEAVVLRDIGLSYLLEGRPADALPHLERAVVAAASTGYRVMEAGALTVWARALVALDRPIEAQQLLDRARAVEATLDTLGREAVHELITRMARELEAAGP